MPKQMNTQLILAPMHGLTDPIMRGTLTQIGGYNECVSEFIRITHTIHNESVWYKYIPELRHKNKTPNGIPCVVQLLGGNPEIMAQNALVVAGLGADKIDLNFGCPAQGVNNNQGGAVLLKNPQVIYQIVHAVRNVLPTEVRLSAKMRLGYEDTSLALECAHAICDAGAEMLTVHARTKIEGYRPPVHWHWIATISEQLAIPVVANGDVFSLKDYIALKEETSCTHIMLGRGALTRPQLAKQIKAYEAGQTIEENDWEAVKTYLQLFFQTCLTLEEKKQYPAARLKQWLGMLQQNYPQATELFASIRTMHDNNAIQTTLTQETNHVPDH